MAFEHLHYKEKLNDLDQINIEDIETIVQLFSELDDIEASWYYQITQGRLKVIQILSDRVEENSLEKIIQEHIYNHLWLLDPSWDGATDTPSMEETIKDEFDKIHLTDEERRGRFDIKYKKTSGKHITIELKRSSVKPRVGEIMDQVKKYISALQKQMQAHKESGEIELVCLVGDGLYGWDIIATKEADEKSLAAQNIRIVTYKQLIKDAEISYGKYLEKRIERGRIHDLLLAIDADTTNEESTQ